jgi:dipeptidyl aminopeptidase/acylaminoacyl peptidase
MLADAGIMYLMRSWPGIGTWENDFFPEGYPGGIAEAAFRMDVVESAVRYLDSRSMIDPAKVGLIGFSRGGWYTEYALAHSRIRFRAATATDNVQYSMGEYWYLHDQGILHGYEAMYGGPPYGKTFENWSKYSISFNLDKVNTPLLMEVMGEGLQDDNPHRPPYNMAVHNEVFAGLTTLKKPVELYYYPNEQHQMAGPLARVDSLQRNIDWYRFWLQGYERASPEDPDQYKRWELMRSQVDLK